MLAPQTVGLHLYARARVFPLHRLAKEEDVSRGHAGAADNVHPDDRFILNEGDRPVRRLIQLHAIRVVLGAHVGIGAPQFDAKVGVLERRPVLAHHRRVLADRLLSAGSVEVDDFVLQIRAPAGLRVPPALLGAHRVLHHDACNLGHVAPFNLLCPSGRATIIARTALRPRRDAPAPRTSSPGGRQTSPRSPART